MSNANFNTINVKQLNFTGDHILKRGQPTMLATLDMSGVGHYKRLCVDNLALGKGKSDCIDLTYVLDVSGASKLTGFIHDSTTTHGGLGQVITATASGWAWQDPSNGGVTVQSKWLAGNSGQGTSTIYHSNPVSNLARVGIGNFSTTGAAGQAKATLDVESGTSTESMRSSFKLGTISSTGVFQNAPFSAMMGDGNSLNGIDTNHGSSFILGHSCTLTGWSCAAIGRHNVVNMPNPVSSYASKGAIALGNYAYAGIKDTAAGPGDIGFAIGTGIDNVAGEPTYSSNNNKFVIDIDGNVGIGTNAPSEKLHVNGDVKIDNGIYFSDAANSSITIGNNVVGNYLDISSNSTSIGFQCKAEGDKSTAIGHLATASGKNSTAMGYDTKASEEYSTAMGFNTSASGKNTTAMGYLSDASGRFCTAIGNHAYAGGDIQFAIGISPNPGANALATPSANNNKFVIDISGNVGIGTTSPGAKLDVVGDISCNGDIHIGTSAAGNPINKGGLIFPYPNPILIGSEGILNPFEKPTATSNFCIAIGHGTSSSDTNTIAIGQEAAAVGAGSIAIGASSGTPGNNFVNTICIGEGVTVTAANMCRIGNNNIKVGIGTSSPTEKLEVIGTVKATAFDGVGSFSSVDINSGTIDGTTIGASSASTGKFTSLEATNTITGSVNGSSASCTGNAATATTAGTVTTPAQPNITSVGTLTGLTVTNTIAGSVNGSSASCTGNADTATILQNTRTIGGVNFNGSASIDLPGVNTIGNQNTTGNAATATKIDSITNTDIVQLTATQTLTNKTLTSPTITGTLTAGGGAGTSGQVLSSTGSGLSWADTTWTTTTGGIYYDSGKVGIGTNSPSAKLEVVGDISGNGALTLPNLEISGKKISSSSTSTNVANIIIDPSNGWTNLTGDVRVRPPTEDMNPATKQYVDQTATGLKVQEHVSLATTGNIASFNGNITVDSTMTTPGSRILVKNQNTKTENGVWVASAGQWTRATDFAVPDNVTGFYFFVDDGSGNLHTGWVVNGADVIVGTSEIIFSQFSTTGDIQAGKGLTKTGETLDITACDSNGHYTLSQPTITIGTIDGTTIGASSASTGKFTDLTATGTSTLATVDINGGNIDGTTIGAAAPAAGTFSSVDINGGAIDGTTIGATTPAAGKFTTLEATTSIKKLTSTNPDDGLKIYYTNSTRTTCELSAAANDTRHGSLVLRKDAPPSINGIPNSNVQVSLVGDTGTAAGIAPYNFIMGDLCLGWGNGEYYEGPNPPAAQELPAGKLDVQGNIMCRGGEMKWAHGTNSTDFSTSIKQVSSTQLQIDWSGTGSPSNAELLLLPSGGNVGIGTNAPQAKLHIKDIMKFISGVESSGYDWGSVSRFDTPIDGSIGNYGLRSDNIFFGLDHSNQQLLLFDSIYQPGVSGTSYELRFAARGTYSIGPTTYQAKQVKFVFGSQDGGADNFEFNGGLAIGKSTDGYIGTSAPANGLIVQNNVGIGHNAPTDPLDIKTTGNDKGIMIRNSDNTEAASLKTAGYGYLRLLKNSTTLGVMIRGDGTSWFNDGNVGIGTNSPSAKLDVAGDIKFTGTLYQNGSAFSSSKWSVANQGPTAIYYTSGNVGIGIPYSNFPLEVGTHVPLGPTSAFSYFRRTQTSTTSTGPNNIIMGTTGGNITTLRDISIYSASDIWIGGTSAGLTVSSDERIKENITEVPDNLALQMLRDIDCNYYEYKDKSAGTQKTIGFIAQQVKEHLPMAVSLQKSIIPNEMRVLEANWDGLNMSSDLTDVSGVKYRFYVSNDPSGNDEVKKEIVGNEDNTFTFDKHYNNVFCYGKEVDDFHTLDKQKLFTVNFSATQEIDKIQQEEKTKLAAAEERITALETENATLKAQLNSIEARLAALETN